MLSGPAGIGKSELAKAVSLWLLEHGAVRVVLWDSAFEQGAHS
jgi:hypothetical protein